MNNQKRTYFILFLGLSLLVLVAYQIYSGNAYFGTRFHSRAHSRVDDPGMYWGIIISEAALCIHTFLQIYKK